MRDSWGGDELSLSSIYLSEQTDGPELKELLRDEELRKLFKFIHAHDLREEALTLLEAKIDAMQD